VKNVPKNLARVIFLNGMGVSNMKLARTHSPDEIPLTEEEYKAQEAKKQMLEQHTHSIKAKRTKRNFKIKEGPIPSIGDDWEHYEKWNNWINIHFTSTPKITASYVSILSRSDRTIPVLWGRNQSSTFQPGMHIIIRKYLIYYNEGIELNDIKYKSLYIALKVHNIIKEKKLYRDIKF
jgi:hypothetical protein